MWGLLRHGTPGRRGDWRSIMQKHSVGYLIGSLAKNSINRKLAMALVKLAPSHLEMTEIPFKDLPL
jgi:chromate reductase